MVKHDVLANRFMRHTLVLAAVIIIALIAYNSLLVVPSFTGLLTRTAEDNAVRVTKHLESYLLESKQSAIGRQSLHAELLDEIGSLKRDFELMNLKAFSPSGEVVFSGNQQEIGDINQRPYFRDVVASGRVFAQVVPKDKESLEGRKVTSDVVETYVPLMRDGKFLGALEIYYDITDRKRDLDGLVWRSSVITYVFAAGLLAAMILILRQERASMKKRRQLEEERLRRGRLEGVLEMAGAACHELGQPLQTILLYSDLLSRRAPENSPLSGDLIEIRTAVTQLGSVTKKLMNITRYETKEYVKGARIIDIDKASSSEVPPRELLPSER